MRYKKNKTNKQKRIIHVIKNQARSHQNKNSERTPKQDFFFPRNSTLKMSNIPGAAQLFDELDSKSTRSLWKSRNSGNNEEMRGNRAREEGMEGENETRNK